MPKYLTASQLLAATQGIDTSAIATAELAPYITAAESAIDAYCGTSFEYRARNLQTPWNPETRRILNNWTPVPIQSVERLRIQVSTQTVTGNPFVANIPPADIVLDNTDGWLEIVSLQAILYGLAPTIINLGLNTIIALLDCHTGYYLVQSGEQLTPPVAPEKAYTSGRAYWVQSITQAPNQAPFAPQPVPPVVYQNGAQTTLPYTVDFVNGSVTFTGAQPATTDVVSADYTYAIPDEIREATRFATLALLAERNPNLAGMAGLSSLGLPGQMSMTRTADGNTLPKISRMLLGPYRHLAAG